MWFHAPNSLGPTWSSVTNQKYHPDNLLSSQALKGSLESHDVEVGERLSLFTFIKSLIFWKEILIQRQRTLNLGSKRSQRLH